STQRAAGAVIDTTKGFDIRDLWLNPPASSVTANTTAMIRGALISPNTTASLDTLNCETDGSFDISGPWVQVGQHFSVVIQASTNKLIPFNIMTGVTNASTAAVVYNSPAFYPFLRLRIGTAAGTFTAASLQLYYQANPYFQTIP